MIKSLLLGSAAAMVAVSGVHAADAVTIEPEPVNYVRVCDAYGSGFFYIPGTEACLKFSGYVRSHYVSTSAEGDLKVGSDYVENAEASANVWKSRARFDADMRHETDLGTLRSLIRLQATHATSAADRSGFEVNQAFISLAGFRAGISGSLFNGNFAVVNFEGVGSEEGLTYGFSNGHVVDYTFAADGLSVSLGAEVGDGNDASDASVLGKVEYSDDVSTIGFVGENNETGSVYKIYGDTDLSDVMPGGRFGGWYAWEDPEEDGEYGRLGVASSWGLAFQMSLSDDVEFMALHNAGDLIDTATASGDFSQTSVGINWYPVAGLKVFGAYVFGDASISAGDDKEGKLLGQVFKGEFEGDQFSVGLKRSF